MCIRIVRQYIENNIKVQTKVVKKQTPIFVAFPAHPPNWLTRNNLQSRIRKHKNLMSCNRICTSMWCVCVCVCVLTYQILRWRSKCDSYFLQLVMLEESRDLNFYLFFFRMRTINTIDTTSRVVNGKRKVV